MPFKNKFLTILKIFRPNGSPAIIAKGGPNAAGEGQAVIQFYTGLAGELSPGEITASGTTNGTDTIYEMIVTSPSALNPSLGYNHYQMRMSAENHPSSGWTNNLRLYGNATYFLPPLNSGSPVNSHVAYMGKIYAADATLLTIGNATDNVKFNNPPDLAINEATITSLNGCAIRAGYGFTVSRIGDDMAMINGQLTNTSGAAITSGATIVTAGGMPAWAVAPTNQKQTVSLTGNNVASTTTDVAHCEIATDGTVRVSNCSIANGGVFAVFGVFRIPGSIA